MKGLKKITPQRKSFPEMYGSLNLVNSQTEATGSL
jgi:hypothetical protein